jgi:hypothetical protein
VHELIGRRLADVHIGAACEMLSGDLGSSPASPVASATAISRSSATTSVARRALCAGISATLGSS